MINKDFKFRHNERVPFNVLGELKSLYSNLENALEEQFPEIDFSFDLSNQSESFYILAQEPYDPKQDFFSSIEVSIRNHSNFADSSYDKDFLLSRYSRWSDLHEEVISEIETWWKSL